MQVSRFKVPPPQLRHTFLAAAVSSAARKKSEGMEVAQLRYEPSQLRPPRLHAKLSYRPLAQLRAGALAAAANNNWQPTTCGWHSCGVGSSELRPQTRNALPCLFFTQHQFFNVSSLAHFFPSSFLLILDLHLLFLASS